MVVYSVKRIVFESYPVLLVCVVIGLVGGAVLETSMSGVAGTLVVAMVPPLNGLGGNLGSILGCRLASALHLGTVEPRLAGQKVLHGNLAATVLAGFGMFVFMGAIYFASAYTLGLGTVGALKHAFVFILAGLLLLPVIISSTLMSAFVSFKKGLDPDNVVIPVMTSIVDLSAVVCLLIIAVRIIGV